MTVANPFIASPVEEDQLSFFPCLKRLVDLQQSDYDLTSRLHGIIEEFFTGCKLDVQTGVRTSAGARLP
jgi:hypothetical protein